MIELIVQYMGVTPQVLWFVVVAVFVAGLVRGFAGFALSAIVMASIVTFIPPIELIPICFVLECIASVAMFRGGMKDADMKVVGGLVIASIIGLPIGLWVTVSVDVELSKMIALLVVLGLTASQFANFRVKFLATKAGLYTSGIVAGIVTGLASVGGLAIALYVLARDAEPRQMRASLVMYLAWGMFASLVFQLLFGVLDMQALWRGLILSPVLLAGVFIGTSFFRPSLVHLYKRVCLILLVLLCVVGLAQQLPL